MAVLRPGRKRGRQQTHGGRILVYARRGALIVAKWPRKRGPPKSPKQRFWVDWFRQANRLAKYADAMSQARAIEMAKGSGLYPRDILLMAMRGRLYHWIDETGWRWYSVAAIGDISGSLDVLAQTVGNVLVRAVDRWRPAGEGIEGDVLTQGAVGAPPSFQPVVSGAGTIQQDLPGTPIAPDGTKKFYDLDVGAYAILDITIDNVGFAVSSYPQVRFSTDGGATFKAGATDYAYIFNTPTVSGNGLRAELLLGLSNGTTGHRGMIRITGLRTPRTSSKALVAGGNFAGANVGGYTQFAGPITHIRIINVSTAFFNAGSILVVGTLKG